MRALRIVPRMVLVGVAVLLPGCTATPPDGPDLLTVTCQCQNSCDLYPIPFFDDREICTDASTEMKAKEAAQLVCNNLNEGGSCSVSCTSSSHQVTSKGCSNGSYGYYTGGSGQTQAEAVEPSKISVTGNDIDQFIVAPETFKVHTTRDGSSLRFEYLHGKLGPTAFDSSGIFGASSHTIEGGRLSGAPFTVTVQPDGTFVLPLGTKFMMTGLLDGNRVSLDLTNLHLTGEYDEAANKFTLAGVVVAPGADIVMNVDLRFNFTNRPPRAMAGPDQIVECSDSSQTAMVNLSGSGSSDPDGSDDIVALVWLVDQVKVASGAEVSVPIGLGTHQIHLVVLDQHRSSGEDSLSVTVSDTSPPEISLAQPVPTTYTHSETIVLDYKVLDACTGVDSINPLMDEVGVVGGHGLQSGQPIHLLTELALGQHTFSVSAADEQGNVGTSSVTFVVAVTPESLEEAVIQLIASGAISQQGQALLGRLDGATRLFHEGKCGAASKVYSSFLRTIDAQRGKSIDPKAAEILVADAQFLIDQCP